MSHARFGRVAALAFAVVVLTASTALHAQAQKPGDSRAPSAKAVAAATELLTIKGATAVFEPIVTGVIESVKTNFLPTNPNLSKELTEVALKLRKDYEAKRAEIVREAAIAYAERFTETELADLVAFYKSPLGKKMAAEEPNAIDESMKRAQVWADGFSGDVMEKFREEMKKKGHTL